MKLAIFLLFAAGAAVAQPKAPPVVPVKAIAVKLAPAVDEASAVGTLRADESVTIRPEIAGRVAEIRFNEGQGVARGALLVKLDQSELSAVVASSTAQAKLDKQRLERSEDLHRRSFISQQALDEARSNYAKSSAKQKEDEARLAKSEMRAAFPGVAGLRQVSEGQYVAAGTDIARLEKIDLMKLDFRIPEAFFSKLRAGQPLKVAVDSYPGQAFSGSIYALETGIDEGTRTVLVRARVSNGELKLRPGMFARVQLQLSVREKALWIPEEAIVPRGQDSFVFRVLKDANGGGKVELVPVQTGARKVGEVEVTKGLAAGELVVTEGTQRLAPGAAVNLMPDRKPAAEAPAKKG